MKLSRILRLCLVAILPLLLTLSALVPVSADPPPGLVSWWRAEGNANDSAGSNNHGTPQGGASFAPGRIGQAFSFDGQNDYISVPDSASLQPTNLTLEGWFQFSAAGGDKVLVAKAVGSWVWNSYAIWFHGNGPDLRGTIGDPSGKDEIYAPFSPVVGRWYYIAYTFDDTTNTHQLFIDGVKVAEGATSRSIVYDSHPVTIGADIDNDAPAGWFAGLADEVKIYNRALSAAEIKANYGVWDAVSDFSIASNPNSAWSYGWTSSVGAPFNPLGYFHSGTINGVYNEAWTRGPGTGSGDFPAVSRTRGDMGWWDQTTYHKPDLLTVHPGDGGKYIVVRWTAPLAGQYQIQGRFEGVDLYNGSDSDRTDARVLRNSSGVLFQDEYVGPGEQSPFSLTVALNAGDTVDFAVGMRGNYNHDSTGLAATITSTAPANQPPVANNDNYSTNQGETLTINAPGVLANDFDPDGGPNSLTAWKVLPDPQHGIVTLNLNGSFTYTPYPGFSGTDSFHYKASDGILQSAEPGATVTIDVLPPPKFSMDTQFLTDIICTPLVMNTNASGNQYWFVKAKGDTLSITLTAHAVNNTDPETVEARVYDTVTGLQVGGMLSVSYPAGKDPGFEASNTLIYPTQTGGIYRVKITTPGTPGSQSHYKLRFEGAAEAAIKSPSFASLESVPNNRAESVIWFFNVAQDENLAVRVFQQDTPGFGVPNTQVIRLQWENPSGVQIGSEVQLTGAYPIDQTISAPGAATNPGSWRLRVAQADAHYRLQRVDSSADHDIYVTPITYGRGKISGKVITGNGTPFTAAVTINLLRGDGTPTGNSTTTDATGHFSFNNIRVGRYLVRMVPPQGATVLSPPSGAFGYTVNAFVACGETTSTQPFKLNRPPVAVNDSASTNVSAPVTPVTVPVLLNDSDPDFDILKVTSATQAANGTVIFSASSVTYTPNLGFSGTDSFTYTISDGYGGTATATVTISVNIPTTAGGKITAGVLRFGNNGRGGFNVQSDKNGVVKGELEYQNGSTNLHAKTMTAIGIWSGGKRGWFAGVLTDGRKFAAYVEDNGEPGTNDLFKLWVDGVLQNGDGKLTGGNIQIHKS